MNPHRTYEDNMAVLKKVLTQRTYTALSRRNIEFVLKHQNDSLQELAAYLQRRQTELRHKAIAKLNLDVHTIILHLGPRQLHRPLLF